MNQAMKQRLTGALVLGCLALIFIPLLLDGEGVQPAGPEPAAIPPAPALSEAVFREPQRPLVRADQQSADSEPVGLEALDEPADMADINSPAVSVAAPSAEESAASAAAAPTEQVEATPAEQVARLPSGLPEGWSVRLGVFGDKANAEKLLKQLVDADYKAYSRRIAGTGADRTGIFVGPVLSRADANQLIRELSDEFQLNGLVVRFEIETPR